MSASNPQPSGLGPSFTWVPPQPCGRQYHLDWVNTAAYDLIHSSSSSGGDLWGGSVLRGSGSGRQRVSAIGLVVECVLATPSCTVLRSHFSSCSHSLSTTHFYQRSAGLTESSVCSFLLHSAGRLYVVSLCLPDLWVFISHLSPVFVDLLLSYWLWLHYTLARTHNQQSFLVSVFFIQWFSCFPGLLPALHTVTLHSLNPMSGKERGRAYSKFRYIRLTVSVSSCASFSFADRRTLSLLSLVLWRGISWLVRL